MSPKSIVLQPLDIKESVHNLCRGTAKLWRKASQVAAVMTGIQIHLILTKPFLEALVQMRVGELNGTLETLLRATGASLVHLSCRGLLLWCTATVIEVLKAFEKKGAPLRYVSVLFCNNVQLL